jgi:hypothetical protein
MLGINFYITVVSLCYFIKQILNGFPCRIALIHALGIYSYIAWDIVFTLSENLAISRVHGSR